MHGGQSVEQLKYLLPDDCTQWDFLNLIKLYKKNPSTTDIIPNVRNSKLQVKYMVTEDDLTLGCANALDEIYRLCIIELYTWNLYNLVN